MAAVMLPSLGRRTELEASLCRPRPREEVVDRGVLGVGAMVSGEHESDPIVMKLMMDRGEKEGRWSQRVARGRRRKAVGG